MARQKKYSRQQLIDGAFEVVAEHGFRNFTAREVAKKLHSSTQPIYLEFSGMDDLKEAVSVKLHDYLRTKIFTRTITGDNVIDMGLSYIYFATHESELFKCLFVEDYGGGERMYSFSNNTFTERARADETYARLTPFEMAQLHDATWITVTGLASLSCSTIIHPTEEQLITIIKDSIRAILK